METRIYLFSFLGFNNLRFKIWSTKILEAIHIVVLLNFKYLFSILFIYKGHFLILNSIYCFSFYLLKCLKGFSFIKKIDPMVYWVGPMA